MFLYLFKNSHIVDIEDIYDNFAAYIYARVNRICILNVNFDDIFLLPNQTTEYIAQWLESTTLKWPNDQTNLINTKYRTGLLFKAWGKSSP